MIDYKILDLFCGAGGLSEGFKNAKFEIYGAVDFDKAAMKTHLLNFETKFHFTGDISNISDETIVRDLSNIDGVIGGPPCQGFSSANRYLKDEDDPRNRLFFEFIRFVRIIKPKFFLIENVPGILTRDGGFAKDRILEITSSIGYNVSHSTLNSVDYGVPQIRKRAFFIGVSKNYSNSFYFNQISKSSETYTVGDAIGDLIDLENNSLSQFNKGSFKLEGYYKSLNKNKIYNHEVTIHNQNVIDRIKHVPQGGNWRNVPDHLWNNQRDNRHSSAYRRLSMNYPSITIDTGHMNYFHPIFNRVPTVRESARIQSFKDDFIFTGTKTEQYRQVGNAVPPLMAEKIAEAIKKILVGDNLENN